jgi:pimeloyl-ACP methyl ester carboxylesterase
VNILPLAVLSALTLATMAETSDQTRTVRPTVPTGPNPVGTISRLFSDPTRGNRYQVASNRSFVVQFWYPAERVPGARLAPYLDPKVRALWQSYYAQHGLPADLTRFDLAVSGAVEAAPLNHGRTPYPVVLFSHGYQCVRTMDTEVMVDLASHGFCAIALDHADAWVSAFPNRQIMQGHAPDLPVSAAENVSLLRSRARDISFLLDELARLNREDEVFRGCIDLSRVGIMGHSLGGAVVAELCATEPRLKAGAALDPGGHPNLDEVHIAQPFLIAIGQDANPIMQPYRADFRKLFERLGHPAYWFELRGADHFDFVECPWFAPEPDAAKLRRGILLRAYLLSFFKKYLKADDDHLLVGPLDPTSAITNFLSK